MQRLATPLPVAISPGRVLLILGEEVVPSNIFGCTMYTGISYQLKQVDVCYLILGLINIT